MSQDGSAHVGRVFGNYRLAEVLGQGGTSYVYRAIHKSIESEVAIKVLRQPGSADMVKRFFHEAVAASQIRHPGIVSVFDYGQQPDGTAYLVMELLQGENVGERLRRRGRLDALEAGRLMRQVCGALVAAHEASIVHRDIKPQNLFIVRDADVIGGERIKVLDFGVAKLTMGAPASRDDSGLLGTPMYMAPEQVRSGGKADHRTDVYQVGAVLYHLISGRPPVPDVRQHLRGDATADSPVQPSFRGIPPELAAVIRRCLHADPAARYQDMRNVEDALRDLLSEPTPSIDDSPTIVQRVTDLNRKDLVENISRVRGVNTLASASVASGFFENAPITRSRLFREGGEFFGHVRQTFEFYRKHLDDEYRQLSSQVDSAHKLWIACVGIGFVILIVGLLAVLLGRVTQGVVTASASTVVYFIVRVFQRREDYYREQKAVKIKYLQYGNDWLLLIQSIEAIPDPADRLEEQRRLSRVLLERIKGQDVPQVRDPVAPTPPARAKDRRRSSPDKLTAPPAP